MSIDIISIFLDKAKNWINDDYTVDILFVSHDKEEKNNIFSAFIIINPLNSHSSNGFSITPANFHFGHFKDLHTKKDFLLSIIESSLTHGKFNIDDLTIELPNYDPKDAYTNMFNRGNWYYPLHIKLQGKREIYFSNDSLNLLDHELRISSPPFDGLNDVLGHLGLPNTIESSDPHHIEIIINSPVDLVTDQSTLSKNILKVTLTAHINFSQADTRLTIRTLPGHALENRMDITSQIEWSSVDDRYKTGGASITLQESDSVLIMLMVGNHTVRRHWITDKEKTRNTRLLPILHFDNDLSKTKLFIFGDTDSRNFEKGISNLLFIHGFSLCQPIESDAPDLIMLTPGGRVVIVECTLKIADFSNKLGKLVGRRGELKNAFHAQNTSIDPIAILICRQPNDQIAIKKDELKGLQVILLTHENLTELTNTAQAPIHPDIFLDNELNKLAR